MLLVMRKTNLVLYLEDQESYLLKRRETLLTVGGSAVLNFNLFSGLHSKSQLAMAWVFVANISFLMLCRKKFSLTHAI
jgi:hypothetical protein